MSCPILRVEHLTMRFGGLVAVDDVSFSARPREITAIIGPNGAGKTTVFNCITGFYRPSSGMMRLVHADGTAFLLERQLDFRISKRAKVARTFQNIRLFPGMTVLENLLVAQHQVLMKASGFTFLGLFGIPVYARAESAATLADFVAATKRGVDAGFDWLELHCARKAQGSRTTRSSRLSVAFPTHR